AGRPPDPVPGQPPPHRRLPGDRGGGRTGPAPGRPGPPRDPAGVPVRPGRGRPGTPPPGPRAGSTLDRPRAERPDVALGPGPGVPPDGVAQAAAVQVAAGEVDAAVAARLAGLGGRGRERRP